MQKKNWYHVIRFNLLVVLCAVLLLGQQPAQALAPSKSADSQGSVAGDNTFSVVSWGYGRLDIFYVKSDGSIWIRTFDQSWYPWTSLGMPPGGSRFLWVEATSWGANRLDVFGTDNNYTVWHKSWNDSTWSAWANIGGGTQSQHLLSIQAFSWIFGQIDLFNTSNGGDYANPMVRKTWRCCSWLPSQTGWTTLDGTSPIVNVGVASSNSNRITMVRNSISPYTGALQVKRWTGSGWTGWSSLNGATYYTPSLISWGPGRLDLVVRGTDNNLYHKYSNNDGANWSSAWNFLGQGDPGSWPNPRGGPTTVAWGPNRLDIFHSASDTIYHKYWDGSVWGPAGGLESLGSVPAGDYDDSPEAVSWGVGRLDLFTRAGGSVIYHKWYDGGWGPSQNGAWESLGKP